MIKSLKTLFSVFKKAKAFFRFFDLAPRVFIFPVFLSLVAAFFEGASMGLLIPLFRGAIYSDFSFIRGSRFFEKASSFLFSGMTVSNVFIFTVVLGAIFLSVLLKNGLNYAAALLIVNQAEKLGDRLRRAIFARYLSFGKLFHDMVANAELNTIILNFTYQASEQFLTIQRTFAASFILAAYITLMFIISWQLTIFAVLVLPVLHYAMNEVILRITRSSSMQGLWYVDIGNKVLDVLSCMSLVKLCNKQDDEKKEFEDMSDRIRKTGFSMKRKILFIEPAQELITMCMVSLLVAGAAFVVLKEGIKEVSSYIVFFIVLRRSTNIMGVFNTLRANIASISGPVRRIQSIFDDSGKFFVMGGEKVFQGLKKGIEFKDLSFAYMDGAPGVLRGVDLSIERGEVTAIVGPTGSGKTTLINLIMRFYECSGGTIFIDGVDIKEYSLDSLREHMALVSQDTLLFNDSIRKNIAYGAKRQINEDELVCVSRRARLYDFVKTLPKGFETIVGDRGARVSGGEKQRISIARALVKDSEILILDEATSALDSETEHMIQDAINDAVAGKTAIVIAHRLSTIRHADKIIVIENGMVTEQGTLQQLLDKKGSFYRYWEEQKFY